MDAKFSLRKSINAKCKDCIFDELDEGAGKWRQQVEDCTSKSCALYYVRPTSKGKVIHVTPN